MDRNERTTDIIKSYNLYKQNGNSAVFVKKVCDFFDFMKDKELSSSDLVFLLFLANEAGIPQYYDLLESKYTNTEINDEDFNTLALNASFYEASLIMGDSKLHRYQKEILDKFCPTKTNRYVLTAPTSFGKTFLVYEIIKKMHYQNILLIFPSISLLSENYAKLIKSKEFESFDLYSLSEDTVAKEKNNVFVFTPERFLSFMDSNKGFHFDFSFVDEIYKIDNSFIIDQENLSENERDTAYRLALQFICDSSEDVLLAGPYMTLPIMKGNNYESFCEFAKENDFHFLQYNQYDIVSKEYLTIKDKKTYIIDNKTLTIGTIAKIKKLERILQTLSSPEENTIVYCGRRSDTERYAGKLLENENLVLAFQRMCERNDDLYTNFLNHLQETFGDDWIVVKALKSRIGIHHGLLPKYIQKEIIDLFNRGLLICLFSTTTITEGVNTSAKNIIIVSSKKGKKPLKQFDATNIAGRAGRFQQHYLGRVIDLSDGFECIIKKPQEILKHKNYDKESPKLDIDYQITKEKYLSDSQLAEKKEIMIQIQQSGIPKEIFDSFKVVGPRDKIVLYNEIKRLSKESIEEIKKLISYLNRDKTCFLYWKGFQIVIDTIKEIVKEEKIKRLMEREPGKFSYITNLTSSYLQGGFLSMVQYKVQKKHMPKDLAIRETADFVYNILKYHLVKYLGVFDLLFRYYISILEGVQMENISGFNKLLRKLEYNAFSQIARRVSDYGVPFKIVEFYDSQNDNNKKQFDEYEKAVYERINKIFG